MKMSLAAKEFPNDSMLRELHEIRERHYEENKHLTPKERAKKINREAERFLKNQGYKLVPTKKGTFKMVKE
ncbi:MAG: hypothetical protein MUO91_01260 [candidate division Zixibacteria bacterium]|jgi:hypothetical protein|nr:hypothetical protein [candidate division Zixibacteria bacterium]